MDLLLNSTIRVGSLTSESHSENVNSSALKSAAIISTLAVTIIAGAAFFLISPPLALLTTTGITFISFSSIPLLLKTHHTPLIRVALIASFVAIGSLTLGGGAALAAWSINPLIASLMIHRVDLAAWTALLTTIAVGYIIPFGINLLEKVKGFILNETWQEQFDLYCQSFETENKSCFLTFRQTVELFMSLAYPRASLNGGGLAIFRPTNAHLLEMSRISCSNQKIAEILKNEIAEITTNIENHGLELPANYLDQEINFLHILISKVSPEDMLDAIDCLLDNAPRLFQTGSNSNYLRQLFGTPTYSYLNKKIDSFLIQVDQKDDYERILKGLTIELDNVKIRIDQEKNLKSQKEAFSKELEPLKERLGSLRKQVEKLYREKRRLKNLLSLNDFDGHVFQLLVQATEAQKVEKLRKALGQVKTSFTPLKQAIFGLEAGSLNSTLQRLCSKLETVNETLEDNKTSAYDFIVYKCGFIADDYQELGEWLDMEGLDEELFKEQFNFIGLRLADDLYDKKIISSGCSVERTDIKRNLKKYIDSQKGIRRSISRFFSKIGELKPVLHAFTRKVSETVYRLSVMGLIFVPVLIHPLHSVAGFGMGIIYFTLRRFLGPLTWIEDVVSLLQYLPSAFNLIANRNVLSLTPAMQRRMRIFVETDFFSKMRILHHEIWISLITAYPPFFWNFPRHLMGMGGSIQGFFLAREIVHII